MNAKKVIPIIIAIIALIASVLIIVPAMFFMSVLQNSENELGTDGCINYEVGSGVSVNGLNAETSANATLLVQEAMRRGLGRDGAAIAITAALTESGLRTDPGGDNWNEPEYMWSMGLFQTKLWYQFQDAWKKPGGGYYPKNDPESIARAKAMALDPTQQSKWFFDRLSGTSSSTSSLANFKWRTNPQYKGKPWMVAQKIEGSKYADGRNYRQTWNGSKGVIPLEIVDAILNADPNADPSASSNATTFTTLSSAFPKLEVDANENFIIPSPANAKTSPNGYPVLKDTPAWVRDVTTPDGGSVQTAKWAESVFDDLFTRWQGSKALTERFSLRQTGSSINGWTPYTGKYEPTNFNSGTAVEILPREMRKNTLTPEETTAIDKIMRDMGGVLVWGGAGNAGYFYITPEINQDNIDGWATTATNLGQPPYFIVGDSIGRSMSNLLTQNLPQSTVDAIDGRKTANGISALRTSGQAKAAKTWIVELGTNDGNNAAAFTGYIDTVMKLAGNRQVFWINAYRPASNSLGLVTDNNQALTAAAAKYPNLKIVDWNARAVGNLQWFESDGMKLHPNTDGRQAMIELILAAVTGNGNSNVNGLSYLCGNGSGVVSDEAFAITGDPTGNFLTNLEISIPGANTAKNRALSFVGNPPSSCTNSGCRHNCLHLAARSWGRASSGWYDAKLSWQKAIESNNAVPARDPKTGQINPEAYNIPIGALVYWNPEPNGHVATYVGDGRVVSNGNFGKGDNVYLVPMESFNGYGTGYLGWAYPNWRY